MPGPPILPVSYFPPVTYFLYILHHDEILVEAEETYRKQTLRNRCIVCSANGPQVLTVPVSKPAGSATMTREVRISYRKNWLANHWATIISAYNSSPYFLFFRDELKEILFSGHDKLLDLNLEILGKLMEFSGISARITTTSTFARPEDPEKDPRYGKHFGYGHSRPLPSYPQVFDEKYGFTSGVSFLDLLCNLGPSAKDYLLRLDKDQYLIQDIRS